MEEAVECVVGSDAKDAQSQQSRFSGQAGAAQGRPLSVNYNFDRQ